MLYSISMKLLPPVGTVELGTVQLKCLQSIHGGDFQS